MRGIVAFEDERRGALPEPPDAVALWQRLIDELGCVDAPGPRGAVRLGIIDTLGSADCYPFWYELFRGLGFSIVVAPHRPAGLNDLDARGRETIPSESVCYPAKMSHIRAAALVDNGANVVFMPMYDRFSRCAVTCEYANAVGNGMPQLLGEAGVMWRGPLPQDLPRGVAVFVSPILVLRHPWSLVNYPQEVLQLMAALNAVLPLDAAITPGEFVDAVVLATAAQDRFQKAIEQENARALEWAHLPGHHGILLAGRPYHWDRSLLHDVNVILTRLGLAVMTSHPTLDRRKKSAKAGLKIDDGPNAGRWGRSEKENAEAYMVSQVYEDRIARMGRKPAPMEGFSRQTIALGPWRRMIAEEPMHERGDCAIAPPYWFAAKHLGKLAQIAGEDPDLDIVCLQSFSCEFDAASVPEAREITIDAGKPFTLLMIDDSVNTAHLVVRLRTLAAAIVQRKQRQAGEAKARDGLKPMRRWEDVAVANAPKETPDRLVRDPLPAAALEAAREGDIAAFVDLGEEDYEAARTYCENYCYLAALMIGRALRLCAALPDLEMLMVPYVCDKCLLGALPRALIRALGRLPRVMWQRDWRVDEAHLLESAGAGSRSCEGRPLVGVVGAAPLVFDAGLNDNLLETIVGEGCVPVLPSVDAMLADDVTYEDQLDEFARRGVRHVIYLMSFGCLKGHTQVRANLSLLRQKYPAMPVTVIDFDGDASSLNRKNRVYLALASAKDAAGC